MNDAKVMNLQHKDSDLPDIRIRRRITPEMDSNPGSLLVEVVAEVCALRAVYTIHHYPLVLVDVACAVHNVFKRLTLR